MIQALKLKQMVEEGLVRYRNIFGRKKKQKTQEITMCFHKVTPCMPASSAFPSTSFTSAAPETGRWTPPFPLPSQPAQHKEEHENLHDDQRPL